MKRGLKYLKTGAKIFALGFGASTTMGYVYLQYVNSQIGPIDLDHDEAINFYKVKYQLTGAKAEATYYYALWNISLARVLSYRSYSWYCSKLDRNIINYSLDNYERANIFEEIEKAGPLSKKSAHHKLYKQIEAIRKKNAQNIEDKEYVIKGLFQYQKELNSCQLVGISEESRQKIEKLHKYIVEVGFSFKDPLLTSQIKRFSEY
jgi:hypothetical protein